MGNHEYCEDCGSSNFHRGRTCQEYNPEGYAEVEARKKLGDYSCAVCGFGMIEPCVHWQESIKKHIGWIAGHCSDPLNCPECKSYGDKPARVQQEGERERDLKLFITRLEILRGRMEGCNELHSFPGHAVSIPEIDAWIEDYHDDVLLDG